MSNRKARLAEVGQQLPYWWSPTWSYAGGGLGALAALLVVRHLSATEALVAFPAAILVGALGLVTVRWWYVRVHRAKPGQQDVEEREFRTDRNKGHSDVWDYEQNLSDAAVRSRATTVRPSLRGTGGKGVDTRQFAISLGKTALKPMNTLGAGPVTTQRAVWLSIEMCLLMFGEPRIGKTAHLCCIILDAPGSVVCSSTKLELLDVTGPLRSQRGRIMTFNPLGYGDGHYPSNVRFTPLAGCQNMPTAIRRANDMIASPKAGGAGNEEFFVSAARKYLAPFLHAAAVMGLRPSEVYQLIAPNPDHESRAARRFIGALNNAAIDAGVITTIDAYFRVTDKTRSGISEQMASALAWVGNPEASRVGDLTADDDTLLNVTEFLQRGCDTLYIASSQDLGSTGPLASALLAEIGEQARIISQSAFGLGKRLDPPCTIVLDEARISSPQVPLISWTADMGGKGVNLIIACQSPADLRVGWGDEALEIVFTNCTLQVFGGIKGPKDLAALSQLFGNYQVDKDGDATREHPVYPPAALAGLPKHETVIRTTGVPAVRATANKYWEREDWKKAHADPNGWRPGPEGGRAPAPAINGAHKSEDFWSGVAAREQQA